MIVHVSFIAFFDKVKYNAGKERRIVMGTVLVIILLVVLFTAPVWILALAAVVTWNSLNKNDKRTPEQKAEDWKKSLAASAANGQ